MTKKPNWRHDDSSNEGSHPDQRFLGPSCTMYSRRAHLACEYRSCVSGSHIDRIGEISSRMNELADTKIVMKTKERQLTLAGDGNSDRSLLTMESNSYILLPYPVLDHVTFILLCLCQRKQRITISILQPDLNLDAGIMFFMPSWPTMKRTFGISSLTSHATN